MTRPPANRQAFAFGRNWKRFLDTLDTGQIRSATESLSSMLAIEDLSTSRFLDAGCGSGLFSLAALRLGATEVVSFDIDPESVECAERLRSQFGSAGRWTILSGSVLDEEWLTRLGTFDIVYSWGVLHHTGNLRKALEHITIPVAPGGTMFLSIYNDQGVISSAWRQAKRLYNASPRPIQVLQATSLYSLEVAVDFISRLLRRRSLRGILSRPRERGMSRWIDVVDWLGGYPYEPAKPEDIVAVFEARGYLLRHSRFTQGMGCNEFVFTDTRANTR